MSRASRPLRRVRGADRERFGRLLVASAFVARFVGCNDLRSLAHALHTRPAIVRRCLLGRPVSARAARRLLG